ncbi:MAG TPA: 5-methyltetrahydropteroyltriglutamate--homocysteine S-methyltransferase [Candidatus Dormibacteraeota bacterium]|nr:5-methyltetrahydropteroyltriglutamate--homocysteine S-methyltransferase [Candidatus Dormibacteraeota bacterium]
MSIASILGYPRIGRSRELKRALEGYWSGRLTSDQLLSEAASLKADRWRRQQAAGIDHIPSNDFSLYDHVLDAALIVGAVPARFGWSGETPDLDLMFEMARGTRGEVEVAPLDMTKWFDTNYHYLVPELAANQSFRLASRKPIDEFLEAQALGILTRPVLLGPVTFLRLSKGSVEGGSTLEFLDRLLPVYAQLLTELGQAGASWVQIDEPCLSQDLPVEVLEALEHTYQKLSQAAPGLKLLLASYFAGMGGNLATAVALPVDAVHLDLVHGAADLEAALELVPEDMALSLGVVDGHNVWRTDPDRALGQIRRAVAKLGESRVLVAPSCSLLHVPVSLEPETELDPALRSWLAFAEEKLTEVSCLARADQGAAEVEARLAESREACSRRRESPRVTNPAVRARMDRVTPDQLNRPGDGPTRRMIWRKGVSLPPLPTTTIGSFPQVPELRQARARLRRGELDQAAYEKLMEAEISRVVRFQEEIGLDVLVHGEPERNDMVEYFAEQLDGYATTRQGWVQSYGSRCAKPPIAFGDISRPRPMTVRWTVFAQSLTDRPVKGMLTGPVTILQWSFVRDDLERSQTCAQIALALRDEVADLEAAGINVIQIDEPALREGLPLHRTEQPAYLRWSVDSFRLTAGGAGAKTQIHTHMCYSEFEDIMDAIAELDADVLFIEAARSAMSLLHAFADHGYTNEVGPGVYDIHSPLVPSVEEMAMRLRKAVTVIPADRLWANPDCGLKTRGWAEVEPSLRNLVEAARQVAAELAAVSPASS